MNENRVSPDQALHDLTLAMLYLTRFKDRKATSLQGEPPFLAWKSYDWETLDKLCEEELIIDRHGKKSLALTDEGVKKAKSILNILGIRDWEE